jgi:hypothetical protein
MWSWGVCRESTVIQGASEEAAMCGAAMTLFDGVQQGIGTMDGCHTYKGLARAAACQACSTGI